jgi:hypothetical protein
MHSMRNDVAIGAGVGCGIEGIPAGLLLGPVGGALACVDGAAEGGSTGLLVWAVGGLWDSFQMSRAQAKAQQEVDSKCN